MLNLKDLIGLEPYEVVYEQGAVLVRHREVWPPEDYLPEDHLPEDHLPEGVSSFGRGFFLRVPEEALASHLEFFKWLRPKEVVFADCLPFGSSKHFDHAVTELFSQTRTVVLVHNTNPLSALVEKFAGMRTLYLLHDLRVHVAARDPGLAHVGRSGLRWVYGDCSALGVNHLVMDSDVACTLTAVCPDLRELETNLEQMAALPSEILELFNMSGSQLRSWRSLILGSSLQTSEVRASAEIISMAALRNPVLRHLQVYGRSQFALAAIQEFDLITSLSLKTESSCIWMTDVCYDILNQFSLTSLSLEGFLSLDLARIATCCPQLRRLSIPSFRISKRLVPKSSFPLLDTLELNFAKDTELQNLLAACPDLVTLRLRGLEVSVCFLKTFPGNLSLKRLEQLELVCPGSLKEEGVSPVQVKKAFDCLPSLRYVAVESYELRLFLESHLPHVALGWLSCTLCAAKFPQRTKEQGRIWHKVHRK